MGTPDFAVPSLKILLKNNYNIVGVVTATDKPAGRGNKIHESAVKKYAVSNNLKVLQPEKLKSSEFIDELKSLKPDLIIVVAFRMLPEIVWQMPKLGTFNLHASLLPKYRGAAPINWAIINGETETGVTTFFIDKEIDAGCILFNNRITIGEDTTAGELHDKLMNLGSELVLKTVIAIEKNNYECVNQSTVTTEMQLLNSAPKILKETCRVKWQHNTINIHNHIRGLSPYPGAWSEMINHSNNEKYLVKIYRSEVISKKVNARTGEILSDNKSYLHIGTNDGIISILEIQLEGKKRMNINAFLRGFSNIKDFEFIV